MGTSKDISTYHDCEEFFEQALGHERGIAVTQESPGHAQRFMQRMNAYRVALRKSSQQVYPLGHELHNKSPYDIFILRKDPENSSRVLIQPTNSKPVKVESL